MTGTAVAAIGLLALIVFLLARVPVGLAMLIAGAGGIVLLRPGAVLPVVAGELFAIASNHALVVLPLFLLMGNLVAASGMSRDLYQAAAAWLGRWKGGLASASIAGCAGFSALSGSSLASALTVGRMSLPELKRFGYDDALATGAVAAGGTLGILIPPSVGMVVYAILTEESIGRLFMAGIAPGLLLTLLFLAAVRIVVARSPAKAPLLPEPASWTQRWAALRPSAWFAAIALAALGGIYAGVFSVIEAAGAGAFLALAAALARRSLNRATVADVVATTLKATGAAFLVLGGAFVFKVFVGFTGVLPAASDWIAQQGFSGTQATLVVLAAVVVLGAFLDGFAILALAVPIVQPVLEPLGVNMVWFGVLVVIALEMGLISPPVGLNVFVVKGIAPEVPLGTIFRGIWPFWLAMLAALALVAAAPQIALFLPEAMYR